MSKTVFKSEFASFSKTICQTFVLLMRTCVSFSTCEISRSDEFYVSPVTSSIKGWVGGFAPFCDGNFRLSRGATDVLLVPWIVLSTVVPQRQ